MHDLRSAKGRKRAILCIATKMAIAVCSAIQNGGFLDAFSAAGRRIEKDSEVAEEYKAAYEEFLRYPEEPEVLKRLDAAEAAFDATTDYQACAEHGDEQTKYLQALDFCDQLGPDMQLLSVCRRRNRWDHTE